MPFKERISRVKAHLDVGAGSEQEKEALERLFTRLETIRELRNHIAHGHLLVRMTEGGNTPILTLSLPRDLREAESPDTRHLDFEELVNAQAELTSFLHQFENLAGDCFSAPRNQNNSGSV